MKSNMSSNCFRFHVIIQEGVGPGGVYRRPVVPGRRGWGGLQVHAAGERRPAHLSSPAGSAIPPTNTPPTPVY